MKCIGFRQPRVLAPIILLCAGVMAPSVTPCQNPGVLSGVVTDSSATPVFDAIVEVAGSSLRARTNERGEFRIAGLAPGNVDIRIRRLGFAPIASAARINATESPAPLRIVLATLPTTVKPVIVLASALEFTGRLAGYYERLHRRSNGSFIARDQIDRSNKTLSQLLAATPGVSSLRLETGAGVRIRGRSCRPLVWLDGVPLSAGEVDLDAFPLNTLHGIEVYLGSSNAPSAYTASAGLSSCGTILLWSRGRDTEQAVPVQRRSFDLDALAAAHAVYSSDQVDEQAELADQPLDVRYPPTLFAARTGGYAVAEFVVDADGQIERESLEIFSASDPLFAEAAVNALARARYSPAVKNGVRVRQIVQQPFNFSLSSGPLSANNHH